MTAFADERPLLDPGDGETRLSTPASVLFDMPGATPGTTQWRAERLQLVNWGGFESVVTVQIHPGSTLLSGASGTGKSTLLDAYTALMMPSDVPFNGASNDTAGRSRGAEQRSLVSYLRGQTDVTADGEGGERPEVMRGERGATWGAVAMGFVDDHGKAFTAARLYYVPASARLGGDVQQRMITLEDRLDLADFEPFVSEQFVPQKLRTHFSGLTVHETYHGFAARLYTRLGIGANGDGDKALHLLARVQTGQQFRTVDALYKEMVLERPATYAAADQALAHFDALAETYHRMHDEHRKLTILKPIPDLWDARSQAQATIERIDAFGVTATGPSPLTLWAMRREADLIEAAIDANRVAHTDAAARTRKAKGEHEHLQRTLDDLRLAHRDAGGGDLTSLANAITDADEQAEARERALAELTKTLLALLAERDLDLTDAAVFADLQGDGRTFTADYPSLRDRYNDQKEALGRQIWSLESKASDIRAELRAMETTTSRIPGRLLALREQACAATGMSVLDLPFLAELIDVAPGEQQWRTAIEKALSGPARRMLVPHDRFAEFSRRVDREQMRGILTFSDAHHDLPDAPDAAPDSVAGKVTHKDSPFRGWVQRYVANHNATCVSTTADLDGPGLRVTQAGQTRFRGDGSHGRGDDRNVIGFTNTDLVADLTAQHGQLLTELVPLKERSEVVSRQLAELSARRDAYLVLGATTFDQIDVRAPRARAQRLRAQHQQLLASSDRLAELQAQIDDLQPVAEGVHEAFVLERRETERLAGEWGELVERKDTVTGDIIELEGSGRVTLTDEQQEALDKQFADACGAGDPNDLSRWPEHQGLLRRGLEAAVEAAKAEVDRTRRELERTFELYLEAFPDYNKVATVESYLEFAAILEEVRSVGLHERRTEWRERLMQWSGQDLVPLAQAMQTAVEDIVSRMEPINRILKALPFGATADQLQMKMRRHTRDTVAMFRRQLSRLSSGATHVLEDSAMEQRFLELDAFMGRLRSPKDVRYDAKVSMRDDLLDVRRHVEIRAERYSNDGQLLSNYTSLGSKSGGETQELIAFIVGAALRYQLGDEDKARPRFAPVFLDEGFIKADAEFASRAVQAWVGLGFQLIVGAPLDKVAALEPHMDAFVLVTKDLATKRSFAHPISDAERAQTRRGLPR